MDLLSFLFKFWVSEVLMEILCTDIDLLYTCFYIMFTMKLISDKTGLQLFLNKTAGFH